MSSLIWGEAHLLCSDDKIEEYRTRRMHFEYLSFLPISDVLLRDEIDFLHKVKAVRFLNRLLFTIGHGTKMRPSALYCLNTDQRKKSDLHGESWKITEPLCEFCGVVQVAKCDI